MNADRRKRIAAIRDAADAQKTELEFLRDEEQSAFDNLPDSLQGGEKGQRMEDAICQLDEAIDEIDSAIAALETVQ